MNRVARKDSDALNKQRTVSGNFSGGGGSTYASSESGGSFVSEMSSTSTFLEHADEFGISKREVKRTLSKSEKYQVQWVPDSVVTGCQVCAKTFTSLRRKHHCRVCGRIVCSACSKRRMKVENTKYKKRTCDRCAEIMICMKEQFQPQKEGPQQQQKGLQEPQKELQEILKLDRQADKKNIQQDQKCFIIDRLWLQSWLDYATKRATKRPGPVTNFELVNFVQGELYPKSDLKLQNGKRGHFRHVNEDVWLKYIEWYGGGPAIWVIGPDVENTEMWKIQLNLKDDAHPLNSALNEFALKTLSKQLDNVAEENIDDPMSRHFFNILNDPRSAKAASSIQRIFRGKLARKRILLLRAAVLNKQITAALTIQRVRRGQICRRSLKNPPVHLKGNDFYDDDGNFRRKKNDEIDIRLSSVEMEKLQSHEVSEGRLEKMSSWYNSRGEKTNEERVLHSRLSIEERSALEKFESNIGLDDDEHDEIQLLKGKDRPSCFGFRLFCC